MTTLDKVKAEIQKVLDIEGDSENARVQALALMWCLEIIDKYASEECDKDCEHCAYLECPIEPCDDAISREDVLAEITRFSTEEGASVECQQLYCDVYNMPSVTQKPIECDDVVSRQAVLDGIEELKQSPWATDKRNGFEYLITEALDVVAELCVKREPSVRPQEPTGHCKDCKYFEYDSVAKVDGIPLIVAHEICNKWGDGCKTKEDGYCFLFEPQERSDKE